MRALPILRRNKAGLQYHAETLLTKEPATIEWLDGMRCGEVLLDVGASVGAFTCYAAVTCGLRVVAVEPSILNASALVTHIEDNQVHHMVAVWPVAVSDIGCAGLLNILRLQTGCSGSTFGEAKDEMGHRFVPGMRQGCISVTVDDMVRKGHWPQPGHIKIDVDGAEPAVVRGARETLRGVKSLNIEVNLSLHQGMLDELASAGFIYDAAAAEATRTTFPATHQMFRQIIFTRPA